MAGYAPPAPIAIDKNIRKAILRMEFSVIAPYPAQPADIPEIAIHVRMQVRQFEVNGARSRGARQYCAAVAVERAYKIHGGTIGLIGVAGILARCAESAPQKKSPDWCRGGLFYNKYNTTIVIALSRSQIDCSVSH
jgi:hypothetical protein